MSALNDLISSKFLNLNNVYRFSNTKLIERESTAQHTIEMQLIALYLYNKYPFIDINNLIMRILFHDLDECVLCDIPRGIKYYSKEVHDLIENIAEVELSKSNISNEIIFHIKNAKHDGSTHGALVQVLDVLQCLLKLEYEYNLQGRNSTISNKFSESLDNYIAVLSEFYEYVKDKPDWMNVYDHLIQISHDFCDKYMQLNS